MGLTYRTFEGTDADYELLAEIDSTYGDGPKTVEELRTYEKHWNPDQFHVREFIVAGGKCIGADIQYKQGKEAHDTHSFFFTLLPAYRGRGLDEEILENLTGKARSRGAASVTTNSRDDDPGRIETLQSLDFSFSTSFVESKLDLERFDPSPLAAKLRQVEDQGIAIESADALSRSGVDWLRLQYDWTRRYMAEEHPTERQPSGTFEEWRERTANSPTRLPVGEYAAMQGKTCVGITSLSLLDHEPGAAWTGLTNVEIAFRRKGIATALKVASLSAAKQAGIKSVGTLNEGHIPMLQLNFHLGFQKFKAILCYEKPIAAM